MTTISLKKKILNRTISKNGTTIRSDANIRFTLLDLCLPFKGYLCYKTITSQNVSSEAQIKNFFIS